MIMTANKFELFLESRGCLEEFKTGIMKEHGLKIDKWLDTAHKDDVILDAFAFEDAKFWFQINDEYMELIYA